jgi:hypothetical protein
MCKLKKKTGFNFNLKVKPYFSNIFKVKVDKLQKGSVKEFITENKQI